MAAEGKLMSANAGEAAAAMSCGRKIGHTRARLCLLPFRSRRVAGVCAAGCTSSAIADAEAAVDLHAKSGSKSLQSHP